MYRICVLGNTGNNIRNAYSWFVKTICQGFTLLGHEVVGFDYKSHKPDQIANFLLEGNFDIIFTHLTFHHHHDREEMLSIFDQVKSFRSCTIIHTMQDARHEPRFNGRIDGIFDLALVGQLENIPKFRNYGKVPVYYFPYTSLTYKRMAKPVRNLAFQVPVFTGSPLAHKDRSDFIRRLSKIMPIKIFHTKSGNDLRNRTPELSVSAQCILGLCTGYDIGGYLDVRPFQYLGAGACMIMRKFKGMDSIIPPDLYYPFNSYKDPYEVKQLGERVKKEDTGPMRKKAFQFIQQKHSSVVRMKNTLDVIEGKKDKIVETL